MRRMRRQCGAPRAQQGTGDEAQLAQGAATPGASSGGDGEGEGWGVADPDEIIDVQRAQALLEEGGEDIEEQYQELLMQKIQDEYKRRAVAEAEQRKQFQRGARLYERGEYSQCVDYLTIVGKDMRKGSDVYGETALWRGMALQAIGKLDEAISAFAEVAVFHPNDKIKGQAAYLKSIAEAPKLKLGEDERVKVPDFSEVERSSWSSYGATSGGSRPTKLRATTSDDVLEEMVAFKPPRWVQSTAFRVLATVWLLGVAAGLYLQQ